MPTAAQWIATAMCGALLAALIVAGFPRDEQQPPPLEMKIPKPRPAAVVTPPRKPPPQIRVNLTSTPQAKLQIAVRGPYVVRSVPSQKMLGEGDRLESADILLEGSQIQVGAKRFPRQPLEFASKSAALISVNRHTYHGVVRVYPQESGKLVAVNVVPLEDYVSCVIDCEMPAKFPSAARQAQAIVARTYALWQIQQADPAAAYDVFATVRSQKYLGAEYPDAGGRRLAGESASSREAAAATRGLVCQANGKIFCTYYSAVCGGATTPGREIFSDADAVLRSVPCTWCGDSDKYRWQAELTPAELLAAVRKQSDGKQLSGIASVRQLTGPQAGVISQFVLSDGRRTMSVSGMTLRQNLPAGKLLSPHFSMNLTKGKISVDGQGFGHGAGLCQWGARGLANNGKSAVEIVQHYYPGATVGAED